MSSSDDDAPLAGTRRSNGSAQKPPLSRATISKSIDPSAPTNGVTQPGISIRYGPAKDNEVDMQDADVNGVISSAKRKSRSSAGRPSYADVESSGEDDKPLSKRRRTAPKVESSDDEAPLISQAGRGKKASIKAEESKRLVAEKADIEKKAEKEAQTLRQQDRQSAAKKKETVKAAAKPAKAKAATNGKKSQANGIKKSESSDEDVPLARKLPAKKASAASKAAASTTAKKGKAAVKKEASEEAEAEEEEGEEYRWWEDPSKGDGTIKWTTLEHNGVVFPPPYEPLPTNVKMKYNGVPITLDPEAEEVASHFGSMLNSTHNVENPIFQKNFFNDFQ
ncbi:hypothetical protein FQN49_005678, partial [Arthroderma sp. PD_2]